MSHNRSRFKSACSVDKFNRECGANAGGGDNARIVASSNELRRAVGLASAEDVPMRDLRRARTGRVGALGEDAAAKRVRWLNANAAAMFAALATTIGPPAVVTT